MPEAKVLELYHERYLQNNNLGSVKLIICTDHLIFQSRRILIMWDLRDIIEGESSIATMVIHIALLPETIVVN